MSTRTNRKCQLKLTVLGSQSEPSPYSIKGLVRFDINWDFSDMWDRRTKNGISKGSIKGIRGM